MACTTSSRIGVYAGSFDPPTNGHLWMIRQGAALFDTLIVAIGENASKNPTFTVAERMAMLQAATQGLKNVRVSSFSGSYLVRYAQSQGARFILRGIRNTTDFHYEQGLRNINADLAPAVQTIALMPPRELAEVSSSTVKALIGPDGWEIEIKKLVPAAVAKALIKKRL